MENHPESLLPGATQSLAEFAGAITYEDIPAEVIQRMKTSFLDSVGCCLFGATLPWTQRVQAMIALTDQLDSIADTTELFELLAAARHV